MATFNRKLLTQTVADDGTVNAFDGTAFISKATAGAYTLVAPNKAEDGIELTIIATTAAAHTVTYTTGFNAGGTGNDVATFGGAVGDALTVVARGGTWLTKSVINVTIA